MKIGKFPCIVFLLVLSALLGVVTWDSLASAFALTLYTIMGLLHYSFERRFDLMYVFVVLVALVSGSSYVVRRLFHRRLMGIRLLVVLPIGIFVSLLCFWVSFLLLEVTFLGLDILFFRETFAYNAIFVGLLILGSASYYICRRLSVSHLMRIAMSVAVPLGIAESFVVGAHLGEIWAVDDAKTYLDGVVRSAQNYLQEHGEYPESLDKLDLPPMPHLVRKSVAWRKHLDENPAPYERIDDRTIAVTFDYARNQDLIFGGQGNCFMWTRYQWTTKDPRWERICDE